MKKNEIREVEITGLAFGGKGVVRVDGLAVFVRNAIPRDRVRIQITRVKKNYAEARVLETREPSPLRVSAPCPYHGTCGGCSWQGMDYAAQIEYKRMHIIECLRHIGGVSSVRVLPVRTPSPVFGYRNKVEFTCSPFPWLSSGTDSDAATGPAIGFHAPEIYFKVIDIRACLLIPDSGNRIYQDIRDYIRKSPLPVYNQKTHDGFWRFVMLRHSLTHDRWMVNIVTSRSERDPVQSLADHLIRSHPAVSSIVNNITARKAGISFGESEHLLHGNRSIQDRIGTLEFDISANSFFQTNTVGARKLYDIVSEYAALTGKETVLDLYCGTGTISLYLADRAASVTGVELVGAAIRDARKNAAQNGITNCRFQEGDVLAILPRIDRPPDVMVVDPPRNGLHPDVLKQVRDMAPERIVYVSCNPATLARDLADLKTVYEIVEIQPVDMFPHTFHIESVAWLQKKREGHF